MAMTTRKLTDSGRAYGTKADRRTVAQDVGPPSPAKLKRLYEEGKSFPKEMVAKDREPPQELGDKNNLRAKNYYNDVPETSWLRGGSGRGAEDYPCFDPGKLDIANKPQKSTGPRNAATGQDAKSSPFSAAYLKPSFSRT
jgi:hypothetical protein